MLKANQFSLQLHLRIAKQKSRNTDDIGVVDLAVSFWLELSKSMGVPIILERVVVV